MKLVKVELSRLEYRNLREMVFLVHQKAELDYHNNRTGLTDWKYIIAFLRPEFEKDDTEVFKSNKIYYPLFLKIYEVESMIYLLEQFDYQNLEIFKVRLINEIVKYLPNPKIHKDMIAYYDESFIKRYFKKEFFDLDIYQKEYVKERFLEQLNPQ